jgi:FkbM family methyltransferase
MKVLVRLYIYTHYLLGTFGIRIKGLGRVQRLLKKEFIFDVFGKKFYYDPKIEGSYDYLLIGRSNEQETHILLDKVIPKLNKLNFIDVGASIGEFVFGVSRYNNVQEIFAFEPRPECAKVLRKNAQLNKDDRIIVFENAVDNKGIGELLIHLNAGGTSSGIYGNSDNTIRVKSVTLDMALSITLQNPILLIDVEGAEPLVLRGAISFIKLNNPLIIFEYNLTSKKHFQLNEIKEILGAEYDIFRLKGDGNLDQDFTNSWNCVAIPNNSNFKELLATSISYKS